jgi:SAM-dependent methyltransferase
MNPSAWISQHARTLTPGSAIDIAAGSGRHAFLLAGLGFQVTAVDVNPAVSAIYLETSIAFKNLDLEGSQWPLSGQQFDLVVVSNYLYRPHFPSLIQLVAPDGHLLYETFGLGNERYGKPSNPNFLLKEYELASLLGSEFVVLDEKFEEVSEPTPAVRAGIFARRLK